MPKLYLQRKFGYKEMSILFRCGWNILRNVGQIIYMDAEVATNITRDWWLELRAKIMIS